jgi:hypothetical protein
MSPIARTLQILLMVSGFAVLGYAALWDMDDATGWQCRAMKIGKEPVQICDTEDGVQTPILLGMGGLALEIAGVSVAVGARSRDSVRVSPSAVPVSFPPAPFGSGQPPHAPAAPPSQWPTQMPPQTQPGQR